MSENVSILIADDHPLFRDALVGALDSAFDKSADGKTPRFTVELAGNFVDALGVLGGENSIDLVLLDLNMPGSKGLSGLSQMRAQFPEIPVVVVSAIEDAQTIRKSLSLGASGYVPKSSSIDEIKNAISHVLEGEIYVPGYVDLESQDADEDDEIVARLQSLTPQQSRVLGMLAEGLLNKQIAYELDVSEATIKAHVSAILLKLDVDSRTQAVILLNKFSALPVEADMDEVRSGDVG